MNIDNMNKEAMIRGFMKRADEVKKKEKSKDEGSSWLGRYAQQKVLRDQTNLENPHKSTILGAGPLDIGNPLAEMVSNMVNMGYNKQERYANLEKTQRGLNDRSIGGNTRHGMLNYAKSHARILGALGLLAGAAHGAVGEGGEFNPNGALLEGGIGGLGGYAAGMAAGGIGGAIDGATSSAINKLTSKETKERALKMKAEHPYATSLPFGDMIGAALAK